MRVAALLAWILLASAARAQELTWSGPEPARVSVGERATVTLRVEGGDAELGALPHVEGLELFLARAARIPGQPGWTFELGLEPRRAGRFELPPLQVETIAGTLSTEPLALEATLDEAAARVAFVELSAEPEAVRVHAPFTLRVRLGVERGFAREALLQPFAQPLDLPVELRAPWLAELPGARAVASEAEPGPRASFVLNGERATAPVREEQGRLVLELARAYVPLEPGPLHVAAPLVSFAYATRFEEDLLRGRVPLDRREGHLAAEPLRLEVLPLPSAGRPPGFTGAVGELAIGATAAPLELTLGESLACTLRVTGTGNLADFEPPALVGFDGFDLLGRADERGPEARAITWELAPRSVEVTELPPLELAVFEPRAGAYRVLRTKPIAITVAPGPGGARYLPGAEPRAAVPGVDVVFGLKPVGVHGTRALPGWWVAAALMLPWLLALALHVRARRGPPSPSARAAARFRRRASKGARELERAYVDYLAARLGCGAPAVIAPALAARLERTGALPAEAARAEALLGELVAARYGARAARDAERRAREIVAALEREART